MAKYFISRQIRSWTQGSNNPSDVRIVNDIIDEHPLKFLVKHRHIVDDTYVSVYVEESVLLFWEDVSEVSLTKEEWEALP
jgi:hypothetical protein